MKTGVVWTPWLRVCESNCPMSRHLLSGLNIIQLCYCFCVFLGNCGFYKDKMARSSEYWKSWTLKNLYATKLNWMSWNTYQIVAVLLLQLKIVVCQILFLIFISYYKISFVMFFFLISRTLLSVIIIRICFLLT